MTSNERVSMSISPPTVRIPSCRKFCEPLDESCTDIYRLVRLSFADNMSTHSKYDCCYPGMSVHARHLDVR